MDLINHIIKLITKITLIVLYKLLIYIDFNIYSTKKNSELNFH